MPKLHRLIALVLVAVLGGCSVSKPSLPVVLYLAASVEDDRQITSDTGESFQPWLTEVIQKLLALHSEVLAQTAVYKDQQLTEQLRLQDKSGLGPDLISAAAKKPTRCASGSPIRWTT